MDQLDRIEHKIKNVDLLIGFGFNINTAILFLILSIVSLIENPDSRILPIIGAVMSICVVMFMGYIHFYKR